MGEPPRNAVMASAVVSKTASEDNGSHNIALGKLKLQSLEMAMANKIKDDTPSRNQSRFGKRHIYRGLGLLFFGLGGLGIAVPLLPTVPLWILAAIFFARSAPELQQKIYEDPNFGNTVRQFVEDGVLSRRSKLVAIGGASAGTAISLWVTQPPMYVLWTVATVMAGVLVWLATRPEPASRVPTDGTAKKAQKPRG